MQQAWGYAAFLEGQREILQAVLRGHDVLGVLPTGGGKSLCYQVPSMLTDGFVLVVSPLISLMQDQVQGLRDQGIAAAFINSTLSYRQVDQYWTNAEHGKYRVLYMAPERLTTDLFRERAHRLNVSLVAVDEAHCVSEWGHNFRPDYLRIPEARDRLGNPPTLAVTATATPAVRRDIVQLLDLEHPEEVVHGFDRPNLVWSVFETTEKRQKVRDVLEAVPGAGIIYASTRRSVQHWADWLGTQGISAEGYHGGMPSTERESVQRAWINDDTRVIVATNAFGMGIDKPDVRFVIHVDLPSSLEAYYQEAGRAGRDGQRAYAVLLFQPPDTETQHALIDASHPSAAEVREVYDTVCSVGQVPVGSQPDDPLVVDPDVVMKVTGFSYGKIRTALDLIEREGAWTVLPSRSKKAALRFETDARGLRRYATEHESAIVRDFTLTLMRTVHAEAFADWWPLRLYRLVRRTGMDEDRVQSGLDYLQAQQVLRWRPPGVHLHVRLIHPRAQKLPVDGRRVRDARMRAERRLDSMLRYARSVVCRRRLVLLYFGETSPERCGRCDICMGRHRPEVVTGADEPILRQLLRQIDTGASRADWFPEDAPAPSYRIDALLRWLVDKGYIRLEAPLEGRFAVTEAGRKVLGA